MDNEDIAKAIIRMEGMPTDIMFAVNEVVKKAYAAGVEKGKEIARREIEGVR